MSRATRLLERSIPIAEGFRVDLKAYRVPPNERYPEGVKVRYALIDLVRKIPLLIVDNHAPFGFHAHTHLPADPNRRQKLEVRDEQEALDQFLNLAMEILKHEV